jgi:hypothetical protein
MPIPGLDPGIIAGIRVFLAAPSPPWALALRNRHPELPLFGVDAQTRAQLLQDFAQPLVIHNSSNVETHHNVFRSDADAEDDAPPINERR